MKRDQFSFSQLEATQEAIRKASGAEKRELRSEKSKAFAGQATPSAREVLGITPQTLEAAGIESEREAEERVKATYKTQGGGVQDFSLSERDLENALSQPKMKKTQSTMAEEYFDGTKLWNPSQYGSNHRVTARRVIPDTPLATRSAREEFGVTEKELLGKSGEMGIQAKAEREGGTRTRKDLVKELAAEEEQLRILGRLLPPVRGPIGNQKTLTNTQESKIQAKSSLASVKKLPSLATVADYEVALAEEEDPIEWGKLNRGLKALQERLKTSEKN